MKALITSIVSKLYELPSGPCGSAVSKLAAVLRTPL